MHHTHSTDIHVLRSCPYNDGRGLIALGGDYSVDVLMADCSRIRVIASFHIGSRITALAWSPASVSPSCSAEWFLELTVASADYGLYLLTKTPLLEESAFRFGGGLTGHHGKVNDMAFCGGRGTDNMRYIGTVSDDKMLMVWDLYPDSPAQAGARDVKIAVHQPTAYAIQFSHPLTSIDSHVSSDKEFLVADCRGSIYLIDWRSEPEIAREQDFRHSNIVELVDPSAVISSTGSFGSAAWRPGDANMVGAAYGSQLAIWDIMNLHGGQSSRNGISFSDGGHHFRWSFSCPVYFAIASKWSNDGAAVHIYNLDYIKAQSSAIQAVRKPHIVDDIDFLDLEGALHIALAMGRKLVVCNVST